MDEMLKTHIPDIGLAHVAWISDGTRPYAIVLAEDTAVYQSRWGWRS